MTYMLALLAAAFCGACLGAFLSRPRRRQAQGLCDYMYCPNNSVDLDNALHQINSNGYHVVSVTCQDDVTTIFFWRPCNGK